MDKLAKIFTKTFVAVLVIKIIDVVKNLLVASYLGVSDNADIISAVMGIPDGLIILIGIDSLRGVVNSEYSSLDILNNREIAGKSFNNLYKIIFLIALILTLIITFNKNEVISLLLPGFEGLKKTKAESIALIIFPAIFFKSLLTLYQPLYNSLRKFIFPVLAQAIVSLAIILSIFFPVYNSDLIYNLSFGFTIGNIVIFFVMATGLQSLGIKHTFVKFKFDDITKKILINCSSISVLVFINQIYLYSRNYFASHYGEGSISSLSYASTISSAITSMVFGAVFSILLTDLSSSYSAEKKTETKVLYTNTFLSLFFIFCPLVIFLIIYGKEVLSILYLRGNMTGSDVNKILTPFYWEALAILPWIAFIVPTSLFLATKKFKLLTFIGSTVYLMGILLNYLFTDTFGYYGISIATFFTYGIYGTLLPFYATKFLGKFDNLIKDLFLIMFASLICFLISFLFKSFILIESLQNKGVFFLILSLIISFIIIALIYWTVTSILKVNYMSKLVRLYKRNE
ncbi:MAG: polysaccharide biosynthesis C-terminal domain-containing protein [Bacteroidetes bacterium]|nr:polysaccharide biosynthesis C-terminal domain-containing protein [Bacteroidota bacterium]